ncbi:MAG TPA: hypothetical protein VF546_05855 [Pyrinomonadaceae bacterium]|jgi:cytochrome oxidase assembly protein ShyY1
MNQLWTIIFVAVLAVVFALASWQDREERKKRERRNAAADRRGPDEG